MTSATTQLMILTNSFAKKNEQVFKNQLNFDTYLIKLDCSTSSIVKHNNEVYKTDWDVQSCESFENEFGKWSKCNPGMELPV